MEKLRPYRPPRRMRQLVCLLAALCSLIATPGSSEDFVLLDNGNVLVGDVHDRGPTIVITHGKDEIRLAAPRVLCWAPSREGLFRYRVEHRYEQSPFAIVADVEWCLQNELFDLAAEQLLYLERQYPTFAGTAPLKTRLSAVKRQRANETKVDAAVDPSDQAGHGAATVPPERERTEDPSAALSKLRQENVHLFAAKVQPILSNRCANAGCHGGANPAEPPMLKLHAQRAPSGVERREHLAALLRYLDADAPETSRLLAMSTTAHGRSQTPPLAETEPELRQLLAHWLQRVSEDLRDRADPANAETASRNVTTDNPGMASRPSRLPSITDPFDPEIFNRYHQPRTATDP